MAIEELIKDGNLSEAIDHQNGVIRKQPTDIDARITLYALLGFSGDLDRAGKQLDALGHLDEKLVMGCRMYRNLLASEAMRREVYRGETMPVVPPSPPAYMEPRCQAVSALEGGDLESLIASIGKVEEDGCMLKGTMDGLSFHGIRDYDDLLGPILEVYAGGRYLWLPLEHIRKIEISEPSTLLDLLWTHAGIESHEGDSYDVHLPVLYCGSHDHTDERVKLGRVTEWAPAGGELNRGLGQKVFLLATEGENEERPLLSLRKLEME